MPRRRMKQLYWGCLVCLLGFNLLSLYDAWRTSRKQVPGRRKMAIANGNTNTHTNIANQSRKQDLRGKAAHETDTDTNFDNQARKKGSRGWNVAHETNTQGSRGGNMAHETNMNFKDEGGHLIGRKQDLNGHNMARFKNGRKDSFFKGQVAAQKHGLSQRIMANEIETKLTGDFQDRALQKQASNRQKIAQIEEDIINDSSSSWKATNSNGITKQNINSKDERGLRGGKDSKFMDDIIIEMTDDLNDYEEEEATGNGTGSTYDFYSNEEEEGGTFTVKHPSFKTTGSNSSHIQLLATKSIQSHNLNLQNNQNHTNNNIYPIPFEYSNPNNANVYLDDSSSPPINHSPSNNLDLPSDDPVFPPHRNFFPPNNRYLPPSNQNRPQADLDLNSGDNQRISPQTRPVSAQGFSKPAQSRQTQPKNRKPKQDDLNPSRTRQKLSRRQNSSQNNSRPVQNRQKRIKEEKNAQELTISTSSKEPAQYQVNPAQERQNNTNPQRNSAQEDLNLLELRQKPPSRAQDDFNPSEPHHKQLHPTKEDLNPSKPKKITLYPTKEKSNPTKPKKKQLNPTQDDSNPSKPHQKPTREDSKPSKPRKKPFRPRLPIAPKRKKDIRNQFMQHNPLKKLPKERYLIKPSHGAYLADLTANLSSYAPEDAQYLEGRVGVYIERAKRVARVCEQGDANLSSPTAVKTLVWDEKHHPNLVWCEIPKVASTSWMTNFLRLAHYRENDPTLAHLTSKEIDKEQFGETQFQNISRHAVVYRLFPAPATAKMRRKVLREALRFLIVRHPFTRLLSAYLDKIATPEPRPLYFDFKQLQKDIIERYRTKDDPDSPFPTFAEFAQYVIDTTANLTTAADWRKVVCWKPYWVSCGVCSLDFQFVMKLETMDKDERFIITLARLDELRKSHTWLHKQSSSNKTQRNSYFRQLTTRQMEDLHQRYRLDFDLFGYTPDAYLPLALDAPLKEV